MKMKVIQVRQVDHNERLGTIVTFFDNNDQRWALTDNVIELIEDRPNMFYEAQSRGVEIPANRRWVSEWRNSE